MAGNTSRKKSTKKEMTDRVLEVKELLLQGYVRHEIIQYGSEKWQVCDRQIEELMQRANQMLDEINMIDAKDNLKLLTGNMWKLFRKCLKENDKRLAAELLREIGKLRGLYNERVTMVLDDQRYHPDMSDKDLEQALYEQATEH